MAGQPRTRLALEEGGKPGHIRELPPRLRAGRPQRRREQFQREYAQAETPLQRLTVAFDYFRGAARRRCPDPARAQRLAEEITTALIDAAGELLAAQAKETRNP
jgi:hypothetical protein